MPVLVDHPTEIGPDRLANVVAGIELYGAPLIIVDVGTAAGWTGDQVEAGAFAQAEVFEELTPGLGLLDRIGGE